MKNYLFLGVFLNKKHLQKILLIMRLTTFFLVLATLQSLATGYGQTSLIKFTDDSQTLSSVIEAIESQSDYKIFYKTDQVDVTQQVNLDVEETSVASALRTALKGTNLTYVVMDKLIVFAPAENISQPAKVTGTIMDATTNEPLIGVNIVIEGSNTGVISDVNGKYSIEVTDKDAVLVFSYIGYITEKIAVAGQTTIHVSLAPDVTNLEEVVVVGYGTQKKSDLTGAISSVKGNDLVQLPVMRADQTLQGRAAGVVVTNTDGAPGGNTTIRVRGSNSITGGNSALVVIDGFQGGNLSSINPNEIESVEVLKDASATAIYGSRGANGVILVTTKRGKTGAPVVDYTYSFGLQKIGHKIDLMNGGEYAQKTNEYQKTLNRNGEPTLPFTQEQIDALLKTGGTDWQEEIYRTAPLQMHQLSFSGGTDRVKYFIAGGYYDQKGLIINTQFKRYTLRSNVDLDINKWLKAGINVNVIKDKGNVPPFGEGTRYVDILGQVVNAVLRFDPATPVYDASGNYSQAPNTYGDRDVWNPVATTAGSHNESNDMTTNLNTYLDFKLLEGLNFRVTAAAGIVNSGKRTYYSHLTQNGNVADGIGQLTEGKSVYFQNSNILTYDKTLFNKHHITLTGVGETQLYTDIGSYLEGQGFFSDATGINDFGQANLITEKSSYDTKRAINSFLGRVNYGFDDKYLVTFSYRADGASVFGANNKWGYFPSASLAWRASQEEFISNLNVFSDLKFRGSWGKTGNQAINPYATLDAIASGYNYPYDGTGSSNIGFAATTAANPNLKWETTVQTNVGVDMGFFRGRLNATVDVYKKKTNDLLLQRPVPSYTGFTLLLDNVGSVQNKGLEITVGGDPLVGEFRWNTSVNITINRSKVLALLKDQTFMPIRTSTGGGYQIWASGNNNALMNLEIGQPFGHMRGFINLGTWSEDEREEAAAFGQLPGDAKWKDIAGAVDSEGNPMPDGKISVADLTTIGNSSPKFVFGWNNSLSYKSFSLSFLFQGSYGNDIFNATRIKTEDPSVGSSPNLNNRWTIDNQNTDVPAFTDQLTRDAAGLTSKVNLGKSAYNRSSRWVEDGSYVRLKNITLAYDLPKSLINKIGVNNFRTFVTASNILTLTNYTGYDPEVSSYNVGSDAAKGIDISNYPTVKTITFGINLTF
jgi:TonB-dependent starch-binding outer membrane protein SusC